MPHTKGIYMMDKKVILIGDSKKFMVKAVIKGLEAEGYEVIVVMPEPGDLKAVEDRTGLYILYLEDSAPRQACEYLASVIDSKHIQLFLIGSNDEFLSAYESIPQAKIADTFERPLNVKLLTGALNNVINKSLLGESGGKKRILVVDDDGVMLRTIKGWLADRYEVFIANSGMNAITFLANTKVDLILLDYMMPVVSGPQVFAMLRNDPATKNIPVMFLTAKSDKTSVLKAAALKPEKYLLKSMSPEELTANIDEFFIGK